MLLEKYLYERSLINEPNPMFFSSFLFLTNILIAYKYNYYIYSTLFFILFITSVIVHSHDIIITNFIDKVSVVYVTLYGGYMFISKKPSLIKSMFIISTFITVLYIYIYGYYRNKYCFHEDKNTRKLFHPFMHLISSLGHHLIMLA